jgi:hypothetical protein
MGLTKERSMANNKSPNQKQPGEKEPGKFHYNPGNMSGKTPRPAKTSPIGSTQSGSRETRDTSGSTESPDKKNERRKDG